MLRETDNNNNRIEELLSLFSLEEIFEQNDLTQEEVVEILFRHGYLKLPDYMEINYYEEQE